MSEDRDSIPKPRSGLDLGRLWRLTQKELRETLRDRRTVITLLVMPLLVYPILSLIFRTFLLSGAIATPIDKPIIYQFALESDATDEECVQAFGEIQRDVSLLEAARVPLIANYLDLKSPAIGRFAEHEVSVQQDKKEENFVRSRLTSNHVDAGAILHFRVARADGNNSATRALAHRPIRIEVVANLNNSFSLQAAEYLRDHLEAVNRFRMQARGVLDQTALLIEPVHIDAPAKTKPAISFGTLIPFILVLMTITGAVYPAIDLTAGERERGTMEALVAAPIPRMRILFAKFVAVLTVAMLTATLNLIGMLTTIWAFRLEGMIFESGKFSLIAVTQVFGLLLLFAAFFSAVLLAVTSFARSFKEAQAYLIPLILLSLAPGVVSLAPGLSLSGPICLVPLLNFVLLARDILQGQISTAPAIVAILSTLLYAAFALAVASRIFGTDAILYGSHESIKDSLRRPKAPQTVASPLTAIFCLTCLFPANFLAISILSRLSDGDISLALAVMAIGTILFFIGVPLLFAWHQRIRIDSGFALRWPKPVPWLAAIVLGLSAWPISIVIISATHYLITLLGGAEVAAAWQQRLIEGGQAYVDRWRQLPIGLILLTHAVIPAIAEEWFFRGFLFQSLLSRSKSALGPILISGLIFGAFHLLTESVISLDRLVPTTLMGFLLAYVCWRTQSIVPGIFVHALNNGTVVCLAYFGEELKSVAWFPFKGDDLPAAWLAAVLAVAVIALFVILLGTRSNTRHYEH